MAWNKLTLPFAYTKNALMLIVIPVLVCGLFYYNLLISSPNNLVI